MSLCSHMAISAGWAPVRVGFGATQMKCATLLLGFAIALAGIATAQARNWEAWTCGNVEVIIAVHKEGEGGGRAKGYSVSISRSKLWSGNGPLKIGPIGVFRWN